MEVGETDGVILITSTTVMLLLVRLVVVGTWVVIVVLTLTIPTTFRPEAVTACAVRCITILPFTTEFTHGVTIKALVWFTLGKMAVKLRLGIPDLLPQEHLLILQAHLTQMPFMLLPEMIAEGTD